MADVSEDRQAREHARAGVSGRASAAGLSDAAVADFVAVLAGLERSARRSQRTLPREDEQELVRSAFWALMQALHEWAQLPGRTFDETSVARRDFRAAVNPWMLRSDVWNRAYIKPHGYPGDYRLLEMMYDLEGSGPDPTKPLLVNCLDALFGQIHSGQAVWHRRHWYAELIRRRALDHGGPLRVLDVACGGARYVDDVASEAPARIECVLLDQDPAALAFAGDRLSRRGVDVTTLCGKVREISAVLEPEPAFDVLVSTGLFDYLDEPAGREVLDAMFEHAADGATIAICNFAKDDPSRMVKEWVNDWPLLYRSEVEVGRLFPAGIVPDQQRSPDGSLIYAWVDR